MSGIIVEGGVPLTGSVTISGAKNSALKIIHAAMFSNEDVFVDNVPRIENVLTDMEIIRLLGGKAEWISKNRVVLNGARLESHEIPYELGSKNRTSILLALPLLVKFGKALVPKPGGGRIGFIPINRLLENWGALGFKVEENAKYYRISVGVPKATNITFKINTHMGTDCAILSSIFVPGQTTINNAAEEPEVDELINFCNLIGADISRVEPRKIVVNGKNVFGPTTKESGEFRVGSDRNEVVTFAVAAIVTGGNVIIRGVARNSILSFISALSKIGCGYELTGDEMRVWHNGQELTPINITTAPAPGFMTDWQPLITLLLTLASGESIVHDTVFTDRFGYIKDLNRMGSKIELFEPTQLGLVSEVSDEGYDVARLGEPKTAAKIKGPTKLKGERILIPDLRAGATLILAALSATGKSDISGYENVERGYEDFISKLTQLGARITTY